jgi:hypothetical protein
MIAVLPFHPARHASEELEGFAILRDTGLSGNAQLGLGIALGTNIQLDDSWSSFGLANRNGAELEREVNARQNQV